MRERVSTFMMLGPGLAYRNATSPISNYFVSFRLGWLEISSIKTEPAYTATA